jgi:hypothetical protein
MDSKLEKALEFTNYHLTLEKEKHQARESFNGSCLFYKNKGTFRISYNLITFCKILVDNNQSQNIVLIDENEDPILIENLIEFYNEILEIYLFESKNYYEKYSSLTKKRSVEDIVFDD